MANAKTDHLTVKVSRELVPRGFTWQRLPRDAVQADALGLLALVPGQDVEPAEGSDGTGGRWRHGCWLGGRIRARRARA